MRRLLCANCASDKQEGERQTYPGEHERVVWGIATAPTKEQRVMTVNGEPHALPAGQYDCDDCGRPIKPGDRCCAWTVWTDQTGRIGFWEWEYLNGAQTGSG